MDFAVGDNEPLARKYDCVVQFQNPTRRGKNLGSAKDIEDGLCGAVGAKLICQHQITLRRALECRLIGLLVGSVRNYDTSAYIEQASKEGGVLTAT